MTFTLHLIDNSKLINESRTRIKMKIRNGGIKVIGTRAGSKGTFPVDTIDVRSMTRLSTNVRASSGYHGRLINSADNRSK